LAIVKVAGESAMSLNYRTDLQDVFWQHVDKQENCWLWTGGVHKETGYGRFYITTSPRKRMDAHRIAFALTQGFIPPYNLCVCHSCDNRLCVNPNHLWLGTRIDNNIDRDIKGRTQNGSHWNKRMEAA